MYLFTKFLGWSTEEVKAYLVQIQKELVDPRYHNYSLFRRVWAQKPYETSEEGQVEKVV